MRNLFTSTRMRAAYQRLKGRISPFAFGHAVAVIGHCLNSVELAIAAELILLMLYIARKH